MTSAITRRPGRVAAQLGPVPLGIIGVLIFLVCAELLVRSGVLSTRSVPAVTDVLVYLARESAGGAFWVSLGHTASQWAAGMLLTMLIAIPVGLAVGSSEYVWRAFRPVIEFFRTVPGNVLIPLAILIWGLSLNSAVFLIVFGCSWSLIIQTMYGARDVQSGARDTARAFRLNAHQRVRYVLVPSALPHIATGLRIASATALIIAISAEILIGIEGIGRDIALARDAGDITQMYALILASGLLGIAIHVAFAAAERRVLRWHESQRGER